MNLIAWTLILGLAGFRLWRLLAVDTITEPLHGRINAAQTRAGHWLNTMWSCPWCFGFWLTAALTWTVWALAHPYTLVEAILLTFAASTVTGLTATIDARLQS